MSTAKKSRKRRFDDIENDSFDDENYNEPQSKKLRISKFNHIENDQKNNPKITEGNELNKVQIKQLNRINDHISESKCVNDLYPFLDLIPLHELKAIFRSKLQTLNAREINNIYYNKLCINDILNDELLQSIFSFLNIPPLSVCRIWDKVSDTIKTNILKTNVDPQFTFKDHEMVIINPSDGDVMRQFTVQNEERKNLLVYPPTDNVGRGIYFRTDYRAKHCLYKGKVPYTFWYIGDHFYDAIQGLVQFIGQDDNVICDSDVIVKGEGTIVCFENIVFDYYRAKNHFPEYDTDTVMRIHRGAKVVMRNCTIKSGSFNPICLEDGATITCLGCTFEGNYVDPEKVYNANTRYDNVSLKWCAYDTYPILFDSYIS